MHRSWLMLLLGAGACNETLLRPPAGNLPEVPDVPAPSYLSLSGVPVTGTAGKILAPVEVTVRLPSGSIDRGFTGDVSISLYRQEAAAPLRGTLMVRAVAGIATFTDLAIGYPGFGYRWGVSTPGLESVLSSHFSIGISCPTSGCSTPVLAFSSCLEWGWDDSFLDVCFVNGLSVLDATGAERVIATSRFGFEDPAWSPDGRRIAYTGYDHCDPADPARCPGRLYVIHADGSNQLRYSTSTDTLSSSYSPSWSPDGTRLAFTNWNPRTETETLHVINADGSGLDRFDGGLEGGNPAWSPDGARLAIDRRDETGQSRIYVAVSDGTGLVRLTTAESAPGYPTNDFRPAWSPDGRRIAFTRAWRYPEGHSSCQVMVMDVDGANLVQLTRDDFCSRTPAWSPDGATIAFNGSPPGSWRLGIMLMNADGSGAGLLRAVMADFPRVTWYPGR